MHFLLSLSAAFWWAFTLLAWSCQGQILQSWTPPFKSSIKESHVEWRPVKNGPALAILNPRAQRSDTAAEELILLGRRPGKKVAKASVGFDTIILPSESVLEKTFEPSPKADNFVMSAEDNSSVSMAEAAESTQNAKRIQEPEKVQSLTDINPMDLPQKVSEIRDDFYEHELHTIPKFAKSVVTTKSGPRTQSLQSSSEKPAKSFLIDLQAIEDGNNLFSNFDEFVEDQDGMKTTTISQLSNQETRCCACPSTTISRQPKNSAFSEAAQFSDTETTLSISALETEMPTTLGINEMGAAETQTETSFAAETQTETSFAAETLPLTESTATQETITPGDVDESEALNPFSQYFQRLRSIYELDLKILEQLADLLASVDAEVLPTLMTSLEPLLPIFLSQQANNVDLAQIIGYVAQTVQKSTLHVGLSTHLGGLDFIKIGPQYLDPTQFIRQNELHAILRVIIANYDQTGLRFPIQKLILGPRALKMFGSKANSELVSYILSRKLYDFLAHSQIKVEVKDGEATLEARMPPLSIVDRCDLSMKSAPAYLKGRVRKSTYLKATGEFGGLVDKDPMAAAIFNGHVDFDMSLSTSVSARLGKPFFNSCFTKFNQELPLNLRAHGSVYVGVKARAFDVRFERRPSNKPYIQGRTIDLNFDEILPKTPINDGLQPFLVFKIQFKFEAILKSILVDHINIGNCDIRLGGLKVYSYCGLIRKTVNRAVQRLAREVNEIHAPTILRQIESILKYRVGDEIAIPLLLADKKGALVRSLIEKADNVASLKADLVHDLADLVEAING